MGRLFSNLKLEDGGLRHRPGNFWGCTALVAGTTVGAGILALPAVTFPAGIVPSTLLLLGVWLYALVAALLLLEVNVQTLCLVGRARLGLLAMVEVTLGKGVAWATGGAYLFLHYALLVAYVAQGGTVLTEILRQLGVLASGNSPWIGNILFVLIFGGLLMFSPLGWVERCNQGFVVIILVSFMGLLVLGGQIADPANWAGQHWQAAMPAIAIMLVALFYHNVIPVITTQLEGDVIPIRRAIVVGSAIPLVMFLLWNAVMLATLSPDMVPPDAEGVFDPLAVLRQGQAGMGLGTLIAVFSEFAIATSFIGFTYGLLDLFADLWVTAPSQPPAQWPRYTLIFLPTTGLALLNPQIFFSALDAVGTFSISILSGILPALMAGRLRMLVSPDQSPPFVLWGGWVPLAGMISLSIAIMVTHFNSPG